jgi:hypothetical protein
VVNGPRMRRRLVGLVAALGRGRIGSVALVLDISNEAVVMVSVVRHHLDAAIRKVHSVFSAEVAVSILLLLLVKVSAVVFVANAVFVGEWTRRQLLFVGMRGVAGAVGGCQRGQANYQENLIKRR